jgi:hypothetical protein
MLPGPRQVTLKVSIYSSYVVAYIHLLILNYLVVVPSGKSTQYLMYGDRSTWVGRSVMVVVVV